MPATTQVMLAQTDPQPTPIGKKVALQIVYACSLNVS
jgi:hypothetical protein